MANLFGFEIKRAKAPKLDAFQIEKDAEVDQIVDSTSPVTSDVAGITAYGFDSGNISVQEEQQLIQNYRELALNSEIDEALQEIRNETFIFDIPGEKAFQIEFLDTEDPNMEVSEDIQAKIRTEFDYLYQMVDFDDKGIEYFDDWYIDGKLYLQKLIDAKKPKNGIQKVIGLDPLKMRKIKQLPKPDPVTGVYDINAVEEFYIFSNTFDDSLKPNAINTINYGTNVRGLKISPDAITFVDSGLIDRVSGRNTGYLRKAIVPWNNLKMMEDAMLIFRVVRAPQRRAVYIDVGGMQKNKADAYMKDMMSRFKNKMVYDSKTGSLANKRNIMSMIEDYWLPRRDSGKGTEIQNLEGGDNTGVMEEVTYYRDKLWRALNVPRSRFGGDDSQAAPFVFGKGIEVQRDEYRFKKFIDKLRLHFVKFMEDLLKTQLILKKIIVDEDWDDICKCITWKFAEDNAFVEFKEAEIINNRVALLTEVDAMVGKYFSKNWVQKKILRMSDDEIEEEQEKMDDENKESNLAALQNANLQSQVGQPGQVDPDTGLPIPGPKTLAPLPPIPINQIPGQPPV